MESQKFDALVKTVSAGASRRRMLKGIAGVVGVLGLGAGRAGAAPPTRCNARTCAADAGVCQVCSCQNVPPSSQGQGTQECVCRARICDDPRATCCPSGRFADQCRRGSCPG